MRKMSRILTLFTGLFVFLQAQGQNEQALMGLVRKNASKLHINATDAGNLSISSSHSDEKTGVTYVYLQQRFNDVRVHNSIITAAFRNNQLLYASGEFVDSIAAKCGSATPSVPARQAINRAAQELKLAAPSNLQQLQDRFAAEKKMVFSPGGISRRNIETELFWISTDDGKTLQLAWNVNIEMVNTDDWWNVFINAKDGKYVTRYNWTVFEKSNHDKDKKTPEFQQHRVPGIGTAGRNWSPAPPNVTGASYNVIPYPNESPNHGAPAIVTNPWELSGASNNATTHGWHFDGTSNYDITRGNNVFAFLDVNATNTPNSTTNWPDTSTTPAPVLTFVTTPNFFTSPRATVNKKFALDNLFYWNNLMHDVYYQYGFTENAGNFQRDNIGRGGLGNDWVNAQAQDGAGMDNANFATPADGANGRMRMYLFNGFAFLNVTAPASIAGLYNVLEGNFSTANLLKDVGPRTGQVIWYNDDAGGTMHEACGVGGSPANSITGKIALINRGNCNFTEKIKNAQTAGAIAVIVINNVTGPPGVMGGTDNTITIPSVMISMEEGALLAAQVANNLTVTLSDGGRDGDLDNGIVCHEYGHGISSRLTGGPANPGCLTNAEQGGEGWSDYFSMMMTTNWSTATVNDGALRRTIGTYAVSQPMTGGGFRRFPYSTDMSINSLTYASVASTPTAVHDIGEVWCSAIWDMTWNIIQQQNSITPNIFNANGTGGNIVALNLVMTGLKLQPCNPGFLDARDAILMADSILYNNAHKCAIWNAFARRGMGVNAVQGSSGNATDQVANFDVPAGLSLARTTPLVVATGTNITVATSATCACQPLTGYVIRDTIPAGFTVVNSTPAGSLSGNVYSFNAANFAAQELKTFSLTLQATTPGCTIDSVIKDNRDGSTTGSLASSATGTGGGWSSSNQNPHAGANSWKALEPATISTSSLVAPAVANASGQNLSILSFWHNYDTERTYDGGVVEYSTDGGVNWLDAGPLFIRDGYSAQMDATTVLTGRKAFTGSNRVYTQAIINFSSLGTTPYAVRFRLTTDDGTGGNGWFIDDIVRANGCGGIIKTGAYNASNVVVDTVVTPVFVTTVPSTITISGQPQNQTTCAVGNVSFSVTATTTAAPLTYKWQVSTNGGGSFADVPSQTSATLSLTGVTLAMNGYIYRCILTDASSTLISNQATLTVNANPAITAHPADKLVCVGQNVSFSVTATSATSYQWQLSTDGGTVYNNINGETTSTLSFTAAVAQSGNKYRCVATNNCGTATSNAATLTVNNSAITTQPVNTAKCVGENASFSVVVSGSGQTYQWQVSTDGGTNYSNVSGANAATLTLNAVTSGLNNNRYRCVVTVACGTLTSNAATLTVNSTVVAIVSLPARICENDAVITLNATPVGGVWTGAGISGNTFVPATAGAGDHTLTYTYTSPGCPGTGTTVARVEDCVDRALTLDNNGVILFPNPSNGDFSLRMNSTLYTKLGVSVYNSLGQLIHQQEFSNLQYNSIMPVKLKNVAAGIYRVKVYAGSGVSGMEEKVFNMLIVH